LIVDKHGSCLIRLVIIPNITMIPKTLDEYK